jgi:hypothetical protein
MVATRRMAFTAGPVGNVTDAAGFLGSLSASTSKASMMARSSWCAGSPRTNARFPEVFRIFKPFFVRGSCKLTKWPRLTSAEISDEASDLCRNSMRVRIASSVPGPRKKTSAKMAAWREARTKCGCARIPNVRNVISSQRRRNANTAPTIAKISAGVNIKNGTTKKNGRSACLVDEQIISHQRKVLAYQVYYSARAISSPVAKEAWAKFSDAMNRWRETCKTVSDYERAHGFPLGAAYLSADERRRGRLFAIAKIQHDAEPQPRQPYNYKAA